MRYVIAVTEAYIGCRGVLARCVADISSSGRTSQALDLWKLKNAIRGMSCCCTGFQVCPKRFGCSDGIARPVRFRGMSITSFQRYAKRSTLCALHYPCSLGRHTGREFMHHIVWDILR